MSAKEIKNTGVSIRNKLLNFAKESGVDYNYVVMRYAQERFLYRLSKSVYSRNFILKGALLLFVSGGTEFRRTKDIDFLGRGISNDENELKRIIREITGTVFPDGIEFKSDKLKSEAIAGLNEYSGVRLKLPYALDTIKTSLTIDVGFGDALYKKPDIINYPVILDTDSPKIRAYAPESVIAEKFEAIVKLNYLTSRMKDFYDIVYISENYELNKNDLVKSIEKTFKERSTSLESRNAIYSEEYKNDTGRQKQWKGFLKRIKSGEPDIYGGFDLVIDKIKLFIESAFALRGRNYIWDKAVSNWKKTE